MGKWPCALHGCVELITFSLSTDSKWKDEKKLLWGNGPMCSTQKDAPKAGKKKEEDIL